MNIKAVRTQLMGSEGLLNTLVFVKWLLYCLFIMIPLWHDASPAHSGLWWVCKTSAPQTTMSKVLAK